MDNILYNISLIILIFGVILMTVYITKATTNGFLTFQERMMIKDSILRNNFPKQNLYNYRVSNDYKRMFSDPTINVGYMPIQTDNETFIALV